MFLTENARFPSFLLFNSHSKDVPNNFDRLSQSFDESLLRGIKALNPPSVSPSDESFSCYLDDCLRVLDVCNSALAQIERLKHRRLRINFLIQLLGSDLVKARDFLSKLEITNNSSSLQVKKRGFEVDVEDLVRGLARGLDNAPREKKTSTDGRLLRRTIHAVGLVTVLVVDVSISMLYGSTGLVEVRAIPAEFPWADSFNELASTVSTQLKQRLSGDKGKGYFREINEVESRIKELHDVIDSDDREKLDGTVKELEKVAASFSEQLEKLSDGVNVMFNRVLCSRNGILDGMRLGHEKQKQNSKNVFH
ncbi:hypothetical protein SLE2022_095610 [Rubroshorea leprosula]